MVRSQEQTTENIEPHKMKITSKDILNREKEYWDSHDEFIWLSERGIKSVLEFLPLIHGDVLELCSGSGMFTIFIPTQYCQYISLDLSQRMLENQLQGSPGIRPVVGNAMNPPCLSSSFDFVLIFAGLHHLPNESKAIQNTYRMLRSGGQFVAFEPNSKCWYRKPMMWLKGILNLYTEDEGFLSPEVIQNKLTKAGFSEIEIKYLTPEYNPAHLKNFLNKVLSIFVKLAAKVHNGPYWQTFFIIIGKK